MNKVTKQELLDFIYEHVGWDSIYEEPISMYVDGYLNTFKQEILDIIFKHTKNRKKFKLWEQEIIKLCKKSKG